MLIEAIPLDIALRARSSPATAANYPAAAVDGLREVENIEHSSSDAAMWQEKSESQPKTIELKTSQLKEEVVAELAGAEAQARLADSLEPVEIRPANPYSDRLRKQKLMLWGALIIDVEA